MSGLTAKQLSIVRRSEGNRSIDYCHRRQGLRTAHSAPQGH